MSPIRQEVAETLACLTADFAMEVTEMRPKFAAMKAALTAARSDSTGCHSIAVWEQIDAALARPPQRDRMIDLDEDFVTIARALEDLMALSPNSGLVKR